MNGRAKKVSVNPNKRNDGTKRIIVNLNRQLVFVYQSGENIVTFDCVSGDKDHATPTGHFTVIRKVNPCFSTEFKVQMDHALFFTNRGHAIHQSHAVGPLSYLKYVGIDSIGNQAHRKDLGSRSICSVT